MRLMRLGERGAERPCVLDENGVARDVSEIVADFTPETMPGLAQRLAGADLASLPQVEQEGTRIGPPIARPRTIWGIGLNYTDHAAEMGLTPPKEPVLFTMPGSCLSGPNDPILKPGHSTKLDWEVELGIVIGKEALCIPEDQAADYIAGYCIVNDVSERNWQNEREGTWCKGKSFPGFCPTGPWLVTPDEVGDVGDLAMELSVNGAVMQSGTTATMIFDPVFIVAYLSQFVLLEPGDLIATGTPPGVGVGMKPPRFLEVGDEVTLSIAGLGTQRQVVTAMEGVRD